MISKKMLCLLDKKELTNVIRKFTFYFIDTHTIRCLEPFLPLYGHFGGFWVGTGTIIINLVLVYKNSVTNLLIC